MDTWQFGEMRAVVDPAHGARLAELWFGDLQVLVPRNEDPFGWGCYPMAPWAGRIRDARFCHAGETYELKRNRPPHALHGTVLDRPWCRRGDDPCYEVALGEDWPFPGIARFELRAEGAGLALRLEVHSHGLAFPASLGWHPWFMRRLHRGASAQLGFQATSMYRRGHDHQLDGGLTAPAAGPWDDCFLGVARPIVLEWPGALRLQLDSDTDHWVIYDQPAHALCVEPWSGPPDALNLEPRLVTPEQPLIVISRLTGTVFG